mgnify:CR=1 FL=1
MGIDEALLISRKRLNFDTLRFYTWSRSCITIGRQVKVDEVIDISEVKKLGINIIRRISGGGPVLHEPDLEITYTYITTSDKFHSTEETIMSEIAKGIAKTLELMNINNIRITQGGNVFVGNRKISGAAQRIEGRYTLQHGTLLIGFRPEIWIKIFKHHKHLTPSNLRNYVVTLRELTPSIDLQRLLRELIKGFSIALNLELEEGEMTTHEKDLASRLSKCRYGNNEWNMYGKEVLCT